MADLLRMSEAAALGLHAIVMVAQHGSPVTASTLAAELAASQAHLSKVLRTLTDAGLLISRRGPKGGYGLARPGANITLREVYESFEGPLRQDGCLFSSPVCHQARCVLGDLVGDVRRRVASYLQTETVATAAERLRR